MPRRHCHTVVRRPPHGSNVACASARVDVGRAHVDAVAARVLHEGVRRVEAHRLRVQQRRAERRRVVQLDPRAARTRGRRTTPSGSRGSRSWRRPRACRRSSAMSPVDASLGHPFVEASADALHPLTAALRSHRLTQLVGLRRGEPGDIDRHLHELLLEQRHAERLAQRALEQRVQVGHRLGAVAAPDVGVHRPALDRTGADERDLDHEVVERSAA